MGFSTTYLGRLDIEPRLNPAEVEWLCAYAELDRCYFMDPYQVPMNPRAFRLERHRLDEERRANEAGESAQGSPRLQGQGPVHDARARRR